jgi:peptidoglycan-associated lipoprotein
MRKFIVAIPIALLAVGTTTGCATKKYVKGRVGEVNQKVETISQDLEKTQERTRQNEQKIGEVDQKAQAAGERADAAGRSAQEAQSAASAADAKAAAAGEKAEAVDKASKRMVYEVVLSEDQGNFRFGKTDLPKEARARLDELVNQMKADPKGAYFEIEGYTDSVGPKRVNEEVGLARAEAVKRYLYEEHHIPLHKMNVISYGEDHPIAPNKTRAGRAKNRRVVIKVLA